MSKAHISYRATSFRQKKRAPSRRRPILCTLWLSLLLIVHSAAALVLSFLAGEAGAQYELPFVLTSPVMWSTILLYLWICICAIAMLQWKKWGFGGLLVAEVALLALGLVSNEFVWMVQSAISAPLIVLVTFLLLMLGGKKQAWRQMEWS